MGYTIGGAGGWLPVQERLVVRISFLKGEGTAKLSSSRFRLARRVHVVSQISLGCAAEKYAHLNCSLLEPLGNRGGTEVLELLALRSSFEPPIEAHNVARPCL